MRILIYSLALILCSPVNAEPFEHLKKEIIGKYDIKNNKNITLHYNPKVYKRIWKKAGNFPKNHPLFKGDVRYDDIVLGIVDISGNGHKYYIENSQGMSMDIVYRFYKEQTVLDALKSNQTNIRPDIVIGGVSIVIPGNGNIYSYGHNNTMYDIRKKYSLVNDKIERIKQSFMYIGKKTKSVKKQVAYTDESLTKESFKITKGYEVTIVGIKYIYKNNFRIRELYLVASKFGLLGWIPSEGKQSESQFEGFYYFGD